jgi:DNA/RNA-binding domain of Phe-tRNA-synthetase-like protein
VFGYDAAIIERYPTIRAAVVRATGLVNGASPAGLREQYGAEQAAVRDRLVTSPIAELPAIAAWRRTFTSFGAKPTQYRSAAEALLRRLDKQGSIPSINTVVDIGNLVSIRYAMPVAVLDLAGVAGRVTVQFATGDERFTDLGSSTSVQPEPGEVVFVDRNNVACARRWCWRQSARSATSDTTVDALIVVEGHHDRAEHDVKSALADLTALIAEYQPQGDLASALLSPNTPSAAIKD